MKPSRSHILHGDRFKSNHPRGVPGDDSMVRHMARDDAAGSDDSIGTDDHIAHDDRPAPDRRVPFHQCGLHGPVILRLKLALLIGGKRIFIVNKDNMMSDENIVLYGDALADKAVAGDLTILPDSGPFLNFHERTDFRIVVNSAPVEIHESEDSDVPAELHVARNQLKGSSTLSQSLTAFP